MASPVRPVILSGGSGTRLWPLSTAERPKQFLDLLGEPLFDQALKRLDGLQGVADPLIVTGVGHLSLVEEALARCEIEPARILVEPVGRNTAPAVLAAATILEPDEVMLVLPSDHLIADRAGFLAAAGAATVMARESALVTFGVAPTRADTGYGYVEAGARFGGGYDVVSFTEKPDPARAEAMLSDGGFFWNSGMFAFEAGTVLEEARRLVPGMVELVGGAVGPVGGRNIALDPSFAEVEAVSLDVAIMERTLRAKVIPIDVGWSDVGTWRSLWEASERDDSGNVIAGRVDTVDVRGSFLYSTERPIAAAGVEEVVVVDTPDAVLVVGMDASQAVRELHPDST